MNSYFKHLVTGLLGVYIAAVLVVEGVSSVVFFVTALVGLIFILIDWKQDRCGSIDRNEKLLFFAFVFFFVIAGASIFISGIYPRTISNMERYARLLLVIPIYLLVRRSEPKLDYIWMMIVCGASLAGITAIWQAVGGMADLKGSLHVIGGVGHHIHFGTGAVVLAFVSLTSVYWFRRKHWTLVSIPLAAALLGLGASVASGSRGSWAAIPPLVLMLALLPSSIVPNKLKVLCAAGVLIVGVAVYQIPQTGVAQRVERAFQDVEEFVEKDRRGTSFGARLEMWRASAIIFKTAPIFGIGVGGFNPTVNDLIQDKTLSRSITQYDHPHNSYLNVMATRGLIGLLALGLLFGVPARRFWTAIRGEDPDLQAAGAAGMVVVVAYMAFSLSDSLFERTFSIGFYTFLVAVFFAMVSLAEKRRIQACASRRHSISVVVIAKNEADRIGPALESVKGWADEIIVLDSGSSDSTPDIARSLADRVEVTHWPGYGGQKQRAVDMATHKWILSLDADERVTPELRSAVDRILSEENPTCVAYRAPLAVVAFGGPVDFGRTAYSPIRLFDRKSASFSNARVHEVVNAQGAVGMLDGRLLHLTHRSVRHAVDKLNSYAWIKAEDGSVGGRRGGVIWGLFRGVFEFVYCYAFRLGFLDGRRGLLMAVLQAQYVFNVQSAIWAIRHDNAKIPDDDTADAA